MRKRKDRKDRRDFIIAIRLTSEELNKLKGLAKLYTKEGISDYIRMMVFESYSKMGSRGC